MPREFEPPYGSHKVFIPTVNRTIEFCDACGEYICKDGSCSNPMCPEPLPDVDPEMEAAIDAYAVEQRRKTRSSDPLPNFVIKDKNNPHFKK